MSRLTGHILVVDDDEPTRGALSHRLLHRGHTVHAVSSGSEALDYLLGHAVDVVMLDAQMPEMSGLDALRAIRQRETSAHLPVIMMAQATSAEVVAALELGADDSVTKPIDFPLTMARVHTQLLRRRAEERFSHKRMARDYIDLFRSLVSPSS